MRNADASQELVDMLLSAYPDGAQATDSNGYLPLHWAVSADQPNLEIVRRLLALNPAGAAQPTFADSTGADSARGGGLLPIHLCVDREAPSQAVLRALLDVFPDAVKKATTGSQALLPLHVCVGRERPHLETTALLVALYPDAVRRTTALNQTPLHRLLDHYQPHGAAKEVVQYLLERDSSVLEVRGLADGCLPLHLVLDCAQPDYALAEKMLSLSPAAAKVASNDGLLPMHVLLSANERPSPAFAKLLLLANPECLAVWVTDIVPAATGTGNKHGNASGKYCIWHS